MAKTDPHALGLPFSCWSLVKLAAHLAREKITTVGREAIRRLLRREQVTFQTTTTWKASTDPDFVAKMLRVLDLYDRPPAGGRVICVDEFGPLNLQPRPGRGWLPTGRPARLRATYHRYGGVRHMFAALDLASGAMFYRLRDRKRAIEFLAFLKQLRARIPAGKLYVICDNFSPHKKTDVTHLVRRTRRRAGVHALQRLPAELDRVRLHRPALLHPRRQRLPLPHRARKPPSPATSAGATAAPSPNATSPSAPRSADPITYLTLRDAALALRVGRGECSIDGSLSERRHSC